jgi:methyl-accepting chemotaxis protein
MFRTLPIKLRLISTGLVSILAVVITAAVGLFGMWRSDHGLESQITATDTIHHEMTADMVHEGVEADVFYAILVGPNGLPEEKAAVKAKLAEDITIFHESMTKLAELDLPLEVVGQLQATVPLIEDYLTSADKLVQIALADEAAGRAGVPGFMAKFNALESQMARLGDLTQSLSEATATEARGLFKILTLVLIGVSAATTLAMLFSAWSVTRSISKPIERLRSALGEVAKGDFGIRIGTITRDDDIGAIARDIDTVSDRVKVAMDEQAAQRREGEHVIAILGQGLRNLAEGNLSHDIDEVFSETYEPLRKDFNDTVENLNVMITQLVEASEGIRARSTEISRASEDLSARTETQAATLEETAAALEEMTASVNTAASNAKEVEAVVLRARNDVEASGRVVQGAVNAMNEIESSSSQISQIIGVIDDIAFQTNLLALNAGVEAARAGDAGRGFAVVASEVRALAQRSSLAAKEIKVLISASSQHVHSGVQQVDGAGKALSEVVTQVAQISKLVSNMATGSYEQAQGLNEINIGVAQLDQVTQHNAAMVEESGAATQGLTQEAVGMNNLMAQFTLRHDRSRPAPQGVRRPSAESFGDPFARSA